MNDPLACSNYSLLLASDDAKVLRDAQSDLTQSGYIVRVSCDVPDTLAAMQVCKPDLLILDELLPKGGAEELVRQLYSFREMYRFPVLLIIRKPVLPFWILNDLSIAGAIQVITLPFLRGEPSRRVGPCLMGINNGSFPALSPVSYEEYLASQQPDRR